MMNHLRVATFITLILLIITGLTNPTAAKGNKNDGEVIGIFSPGGRVLTITNQAVHGQLYGLVIDYCDGSHEEPFKGYLKIIFRGLLRCGRWCSNFAHSSRTANVRMTFASPWFSESVGILNQHQSYIATM
jgi:hypothetical protein